MRLNLKKKPENVKVIVGFPGFGLVGTIATKFLIEHLDVEHIGRVESTKLLPLAAIHKSQLVGPLDIFYNKQYNLVIVQTLSDLSGQEWGVADMIHELCEDLKAKEIIILEGIPGQNPKTLKTYYYCLKKNNAIEKLKLDPLKEGVMMGATATLFLRLDNEIPYLGIFSEGHSQLPDSEAAARVVKVLDDYLDLKIDYKPLIAAAKKFEDMLKQLIDKNKQTKMMPYKTEQSDLDYLG